MSISPRAARSGVMALLAACGLVLTGCATTQDSLVVLRRSGPLATRVLLPDGADSYLFAVRASLVGDYVAVSDEKATPEAARARFTPLDAPHLGARVVHVSLDQAAQDAPPGFGRERLWIFRADAQQRLRLDPNGLVRPLAQRDAGAASLTTKDLIGLPPGCSMVAAAVPSQKSVAFETSPVDCRIADAQGQILAISARMELREGKVIWQETARRLDGTLVWALPQTGALTLDRPAATKPVASAASAG